MSIIVLLNEAWIWGIMLNGINLNNELSNDKDSLSIGGVVTNPVSNPYKNTDKSLLIDEYAISDEAVKMYQKEQDVNKFTSLAMSNPEDMSHEEIISALFSKGVSDPFSDEVLSSLASNENLLKDLSL